MKRILLWGLFLFCIFVGGALILGRSHLNAFVQQRLVRLAGEQGIVLNFDDFSIGLQQISAKKLAVHVMGSTVPISLLFDELTLSPNYISFLSEQPKTSLFAKGYKGQATVDAALSASGGENLFSIDLKNLDLAQHPQLAGLGLRSGQLNLKSDALVIQQQQVPQGTVIIDLEDFSLQNKTVLHPKLTGLPLPLTIPAIENGSLHAKATGTEELLTISDLRFTSSWGALRGNGTLSLTPAGRVSSCELSFSLDLSAEGSEEFGSYLVLLSNNMVPSDTRQVDIKVSGPPFVTTVLRRTL